MDKVFDPTKYGPHIAAAYEAMERLHKNEYGLCKFGSIGLKGGVNFEETGICLADFHRKKFVTNESFIFVCYNRPVEGGEAESRRWLEFILQPDQSPWRSILPYFVSIDPDVVESTGFIVYTETDCPGDLLYNFLIGARFAYEYHRNCVSWCLLQDKADLSPNVALAFSTGFMMAVEPKMILVKPEGYRKDDKGKYIKDAWGDKRYFNAEYETVYPENVEFKDYTVKRVSGENHTFYSGIDACRRVALCDPRHVQDNTFRERNYGWQGGGQPAWNIWTEGSTGDRWYPKISTQGYEQVNLKFDSVLEFVNNLIGVAK